MPECVFVVEHGCSPRPAIVLSRYDSQEDGKAGARAVVEFTDERGGKRDCFARSVWDTKQAAEQAA